MKKITGLLIVILLLLSNLQGFSDGNEELKDWKYSKEVNYHSDNEYKGFFLDEEVYRHANSDLSDIRIVNDENMFVPYYIHNEFLSDKREREIRYNSKKVLSYMEKDDNYTDFKVISNKKNTDILVSQLYFTINKANFLKEVEVYGSYDNEKWKFVTLDNIYRTDSGEKLDIQLRELYKYSYYRVVFINDVANTKIDDLHFAFNESRVNYERYSNVKSGEYKVSNEDKKTVIEIDNYDRLMLSEIAIVSGDDYNRDYDIYYKDSEDSEFKYLKSGEVFQISLEKYKGKNNTIPLNSDFQPFVNSDQVKIVIDNKDDSPINIEDVEIKYYIHKIVFKGDDSSDYTVVFGNEDSERPIYDIYDYEDYIEGEEQEITKLSELTIREEYPTEDEKDKSSKVNYKLVLNIIVAIVAILLVVIIIKKSNFKDI